MHKRTRYTKPMNDSYYDGADLCDKIQIGYHHQKQNPDLRPALFFRQIKYVKDEGSFCS